MATPSIYHGQYKPTSNERISSGIANSTVNNEPAQIYSDAFAPPKAIYNSQKLPPTDPKHTPLHAFLFMGGLIFFPLWFYGAFAPARDHFGEMHRWRCQALAMITSIIIAAMLVMQLGFRTL